MPSFIVYAVGTAGLFLLDLRLSTGLEDSELAAWGFFRSALLIGAPLAVAGIDQALLRARPDRNLVRWVAGQAAAGGVILGLVALVLDRTNPLALGLSVAALTAVIYIGAELRATYLVTASVGVLNGWRLALLFAGLLLVSRPALIPSAAAVVLLVWAIGSGLLLYYRNPHDDREVVDAVELYRIGIRFWMLAVVASSSLYIDQLVLTLGAPDSVAADFLRYSTYFAQPFVFVTGFAANLLNPALRRGRTNIERVLDRVQKLTLLACGGLTLGCVALALILDGRPFSDWNLGVFVMAVITGIGRVLYLVPSGVVGIFGTKAQLSRLASQNALAVAILPAGYIGLLVLGVPALVAVSVASTVSVLARALLGYWLARSVAFSSSL